MDLKKRRRERQVRRFEQTKRDLQAWFTPERWDQVYPILTLTDKDGISCRLLEYLVTHYARGDGNERVRYYLKDPNERVVMFDLYTAMHNQQRANHKKNLEAFARSNTDLPNNGRFMFGYEDRQVETNVAQLQFYRFLLSNQVLKWLRLHVHEVRAAKSQFELDKKQSKGEKNPPASPDKRRKIRHRYKKSGCYHVVKL